MSLSAALIGKVVVAFAGLAAGGMGAYNFATTGCFLGSCSGDNANIQTVAAEGEGGCCALSGGEAAVVEVANTEGESSCCTEAGENIASCEATCTDATEGEMTLVANEGEASSCCSTKKAEEQVATNND